LNRDVGVSILIKILFFNLLILVSVALPAQIPIAVLELEGKGLTEMEASILTNVYGGSKFIIGGSLNL